MDVVFRVFPQGDVIALFCDSAKDCVSGNVMSYMHVGQHGEAAKDLGRGLRLASEQERAPLLAELRALYAPEPVNPVERLRA